MTTAHINKIATTVPEHDVHHEFVDYATAQFEDPKAQLVFRRMVERSHISHRWANMSGIDEFYGGDPNAVSIHDRMRAFEQSAPPLAVAAVNQLGLEAPEEITHLVIVTCTGFFTPGLDFAIIDKCGVPSSVERTNIAFMGCFSGVNGLKLAHHIVRSEPRAKVLVVALELCSLHLLGSQSLETMLSFLIFSDGCAAALVTAEETGIAMDSFKALVIPDTKDLMTLKIGASSVEMFLSGKVPGALGKTLRDEAAMKLILNGAEKSSIDLWAIHPGGRSILDAVGEAVELSPQELAVSRHVLNNYGNMASATILFVFAEILRQNESKALSGASGCALAFGPGLTAETMLFRAA
ncbi:MAG: type III polyketide synthase [Segniliparus sp.]|uniref:type III polyketide synthase n=1 Tax=Segniliparus sp. TaxID=2804064 RepID=UPI003F378C03